MRRLTFGILIAVFGMAFTAVTPAARAQVGVNINIGPEPECPYGYYDMAPYACAPAGYYGPEWFNDGIFIGAGPWFHGRPDFRGHVDNRFHPDHGYKGPMPQRGERADASRRVDSSRFHGNETRDGRGHAVNEKK
jgi:hypothetical protein